MHAGRRAADRIVSDPVVYLGAWLAGAAVFFRDQWTTGFARVWGDGGDSGLIIYLLEHWFVVLHGRASWTSPGFFYPAKGILGYSDGLVLFEVFYAPLRLIGCDQFLAAELTVIGLSLVGFVSFAVLARRVARAPRWLAAVGALVFTFANDLWEGSGHIQLLAVWMLPLVALIGWRAFREGVGRRRFGRAGWAVLFGGLCGLLFFTSYYTAYFAVLALVVALVVAVVLAPGRLVALAEAGLRRRPREVAAAVVGFAVALIPFAVVYLPAQRTIHHGTYAQVITAYAITRSQVVNVGHDNVLWGAILDRLSPTLLSGPGEKDYAVTPLLMASAIASSLVAAWVSRRRTGEPSLRSVAAVGMAASAVVLQILPVHFSAFSFWTVVWHLPGGSAIRAIGRIEILAGVMAVGAFVTAVSELAAADRDGPPSLRRSRPGLRPRPAAARRSSAALVVLAALVVVEQLNTTPVAQLRRPAYQSLLDSVPRPPAGCRSFFLQRDPTFIFFEFQVDAMLISHRVGLPTLNGYTGYNPPGWDFETLGPGYDAGVEDWIAVHQLSGVCSYDLRSRQWSAPGTAPTA